MQFRALYWLYPLAATIVWTATLLGLLLWWAVEDDAAQYEIDQTTVLFISNIGARHQVLFIVGCALTFIFFTLTLTTERWLRHLRRIPGSIRRKETILDIVAVIFGIMGGLALLLLSIFDAEKYSQVHWSFTAVFVLCIAISCAFQTSEVMILERNHAERPHLRRNAIIKLCVVVVAIAGAIAFAATYAVCASQPKESRPSPRCDVIGSTTAALEWFIAFLFDLYLASFILDLWPAYKTEGHKLTRDLLENDRAGKRSGDVSPARDASLDTSDMRQV